MEFVVCVVRVIKSTACLSRRVSTCSYLGGRTPGSKLPASPPPLPRPDGGGTLAVYLCTRPKKAFLSHHEMQLRRLRSFLHDWTPDLDGHVTVQIHLSLLTATLVLQLEPGKVVVVWAKNVIAADPIIEHANTLNVKGTGCN